MALRQEHDLHIMVFSGDDDSVCATAGTQLWIWDLGVNATEAMSWKPWKVEEQIAGYATTFDMGEGSAKLTFATVHGAGHEVPAYRPMEALELFKKYFNGNWTLREES
jgi:carboxypeptidase C (cathepsin A)